MGTTTGYDAIVLGAGHNGLVAAAYLARAGRSVLVLERRDRVGYSADTAELAPGVRGPAVAHTVGRLRPSIARELDLKRHGLELIAPDVRAFAPQPDGRSVALWRDVVATQASLRPWSETDATAFPVFDSGSGPSRGSSPTSATRRRPTSPTPGSGTRSWVYGWGARSRGSAATTAGRSCACSRWPSRTTSGSHSRATRSVPRSPGAASATAMAPWSAGTTKVLLDDSAGSDGGASGETVFARGGPGALAEALASAARAAGAEIRTGADVIAVTAEDGRATGVALASGEEIAARAVVAGVDPKRLLATLIDPVAIGPSLRWRATNIRTPARPPRSISSSTGCRRSPRLPTTRACSAADHGRDDRDRCGRAGLRRDEVRRVRRRARPGGHDPEPRRSEPRRRGGGRDTCPVGGGPMGADHAARWHLGRPPRPPRRCRAGRSRRWHRASAPGSRLARC